MKYPKILIIGQYFDKKSGGGITLTNLFWGWDKKSIAVATKGIEDIDFSVCENVYCLGDLEITKGFPFNIKTNKSEKKSGTLIPGKSREQIYSNEFAVQNAKTRIKESIFNISGQIYRRQRLQISEEFLVWIKEFSPDIIYSQLSSYEMINFVDQLYSELKIPLIFHIMDDWPMTITNPQKLLFRTYWTYIINRKFLRLLHKANALLSISEAMSEEYKIRYGLNFVPFHNPIDTGRWVLPTKKYDVKGIFTILYAGRIGTGLRNSLLDVAEVIESLNSTVHNIVFHIQATNYNPVLLELEKYECVTILKPVGYDELPRIFAKSDLLLLPNDFDKSSRSFLKLSMPTKASEYMVSGTPVLVYSILSSAVTKHALKYNWAYVVSDKSKEKLKRAIQLLYEDKELRSAIGSNAKELAIKQFDSSIIREDFRRIIVNACKSSSI